MTKLTWFQNDNLGEHFAVFEQNNTPYRLVIRLNKNSPKVRLYCGRGFYATPEYIKEYTQTHNDWGIADLERMSVEGLHFPHLKFVREFNSLREAKQITEKYFERI